MEWISTEERLPENGERVIAFSPQIGVLSLCLHRNIDGKWKYTGWDKPVHESNKITHWMPLPEPPKSPEKSEYPFVPIEMGGRTFHTHNMEAFHPDKIEPPDQP